MIAPADMFAFRVTGNLVEKVWRYRMKALAISSSPSMGKSNTSLILDPLLEGMREVGAETELFYTRKLDVKPCQGEFICWTKTPGTCHINDDMQWLLPKIGEADIFVMATPLYVDGMTGPMKNVLDRSIPLVQPTFELRDGHNRHPARNSSGGRQKTVLVSNCGFWEKENFGALLVHMEWFCRNANSDFAGALLRPHGPALRPMLEMGAGVEDVVDAARDAGRQVVRNGSISQDTLDTVSRDLLPMEDYMNIANGNFEQAIEAGAQIA
jgi:multimeric flavodoxin WrbA